MNIECNNPPKLSNDSTFDVENMSTEPREYTGYGDIPSDQPYLIISGEGPPKRSSGWRKPTRAGRQAYYTRDSIFNQFTVRLIHINSTFCVLGNNLAFTDLHVGLVQFNSTLSPRSEFEALVDARRQLAREERMVADLYRGPEQLTPRYGGSPLKRSAASLGS